MSHISGCGPENTDRPPDCNLQSLLRHQTDVHAGLASLDLVQAQQRWASIQSSTALIYQNQNQPDAVGLIRLIFPQLTSCQMLCLLSDCQMTSKYLQTNRSGIARCSSMIELRWTPTASLRPTWTTSCHLLSFYTFSESRTCNRRMKSGRWLYYLVTNPSVLWTRGFVSAAEAFSLLLKDLITFIKKYSFSGYFLAVSAVTSTWSKGWFSTEVHSVHDIKCA